MTQPDQKQNKFGVVSRVVSRSLAIITLLLSIPSFTQGAVLYLEPSSGQYYQGDIFIVSARIDTEQECINTVEANLSFSQDILEVVDFSKGNSILTIWLKEPEISQGAGLISFIGGIPGGYCGIVPGDPGKSNLLGKIVFKVKEISGEPFSAEVKFLESSQVLLNDGLGTPAKLTTKGAIFTILPEKREVPKEEWQEELKKDNIPPEPFEIEIHQNPAIFEGKYFIIFSTTDKQTGIDYYEVCENLEFRIQNLGKIIKKFLYSKSYILNSCKRAESPYLLEDQTLQSIIKVKAVDKAGNERIAQWLPPTKPFPWWLILVILIGIGIVIWLWRKYMKIRKKEYEFTRK